MALPSCTLHPDADHVYVDRTAVEWFWLCPTKFYWGRRYNAKGNAPLSTSGQLNVPLPVLGLEPLANEHRAFGKLMHLMVEEACKDGGTTLPSPAALGSKVTQAIMAELAATGQTPAQLKEFVGLGLGLAHQLVVQILPLLLSEHDILAVEEELLIPLPPIWINGRLVQLIIRVKPDLLLTHKADGQIVYFEWKTTSFTNLDQLVAFEINPQIQLGMLATAIKHGHCDWSKVGLFYKGQKRMGLRTSPFCYGYVCADGRLSTRYIKGWNKVPLVDILAEHNEDMIWWVNQMDDEQEQGQFFMTPPLFPNEHQLLGMITQLPKTMLPVILAANREAYSQSFSACYGAFGKQCDYYGACYMQQQDSMYQPRAPHHAPKPVTLYGADGTPLFAAV